MTEVDPLPKELSELFASERDVSATDRAAIREKLEANLGATPPAATSALAGRAWWLVVAGLATATAIWWFAGRDRMHAPAAPAAPAITTAAEPELELSVPVHEPPPPAPVLAATHGATPTSATQAELLARAWQALARSDVATTMKLLDEDRRLHPDGTLTEEREAMHVQALLAAGRTDEARTRARTFLERWPRSVHRHVMEKAEAP